jgi:hypothetical protein
MYAYCVREFSKKVLYDKTKLFQCISKSKNDCKLIPSVPGFADFIGKGRNYILEKYGFLGTLGLIGINRD